MHLCVWRTTNNNRFDRITTIWGIRIGDDVCRESPTPFHPLCVFVLCIVCVYRICVLARSISVEAKRVGDKLFLRLLLRAYAFSADGLSLCLYVCFVFLVRRQIRVFAI